MSLFLEAKVISKVPPPPEKINWNESYSNNLDMAVQWQVLSFWHLTYLIRCWLVFSAYSRWRFSRMDCMAPNGLGFVTKKLNTFVKYINGNSTLGICSLWGLSRSTFRIFQRQTVHNNNRQNGHRRRTKTNLKRYGQCNWRAIDLCIRRDSPKRDNLLVTMTPSLDSTFTTARLSGKDRENKYNPLKKQFKKPSVYQTHHVILFHWHSL